MPALHCMDLKAEQDGLELPYDPQPGIVVRIARMNNPAMVAWNNSHEGKERLRQLKLQLGHDKGVDRWYRESVAQWVVRGWSGMHVRGAQGEQPYTVEASIEYMVEPRYYQWQDWVAARAGETERFVEREKEDASKNSPPA